MSKSSGWRRRDRVVADDNAPPTGSVDTRGSRGTSAPAQEVVRVRRDHVQRPAVGIELLLDALGSVHSRVLGPGRPNFLERRLATVQLPRIPLPRCEYPGEWLWATPRSGLTLLPRGPQQRCLASDSSAGHPGVARRPPGTGAASCPH